MIPAPDFRDALRRVQAGNGELCEVFQTALSALFDREIEDDSATQALAHLDGCSDCSEFFQAVRLQALAHREASVPGSLSRRLRRLPGPDLFPQLGDREILRRLAQALYQMGKAHVLLGQQVEFVFHLDEEPVDLDEYVAGEGGESLRVGAAEGVVDPSLASLLERDSADHLDRAVVLLDEALRLDPDHAAARIYVGVVHHSREEFDEAAREYRRVFLGSEDLRNRVHAAIQLAMVYGQQGRDREARRLCRWVIASGMVHRDPTFAFVYHNVLCHHVALGDLGPAVEMMRFIVQRYPEFWKTSVQWMHRSDRHIEILRSRPEIRRQVEQLEPEYFAA